MNTLLTYDDLRKIEYLNNRSGFNGNDFGYHTCCDYVDSIVYDAEARARFGVTVFVEPLGDITKWGDSCTSVLDWWIEVFTLQPQEWNYIDAGHYLMNLFESDNLPDDPKKVWPGHVIPSPVRPELQQAQKVLGGVGVSFDKEQRLRIEDLIKAGKATEAQKMILDILPKLSPKNPRP